MAWQFSNKEAVYVQIASRLRGEIVNGKYPPESQIPSVRQLAFSAAVNPNTMQKALSLLEEEGLLFAHGTVGRFVTSDKAVLERAKEQMRRECVRALLQEAKELGLSAEDLIQYIKKEDASL